MILSFQILGVSFLLTIMYLLVVGEPGLFNPDDVSYVQNAGVSSVSYLVGCGLVKTSAS